MSEAHLRFTCQIAAPPEAVFDLVADLPHYGRWLPDSSAFGGTVDVTPYPVRLGTTYLDAGPIQKPGKVTEFDRPRHIGFQHTVMIRSPIKTDVEAASLHLRAPPGRNRGGPRARPRHRPARPAQAPQARPPLGLPEGERPDAGVPQAFRGESGRGFADRVDGSACTFPPAGRSPAPSCAEGPGASDVEAIRMEPTPCRSPANRTRLADFLAALAPERLARSPCSHRVLSRSPSRSRARSPLRLPPTRAQVGRAPPWPRAGSTRRSSTGSVRPGDDFFRYANGKWLGSTEIPPDRSAWGASGELEERLRLQTREILEAAARSNAAPGSLERKVGDFYASAMDEAAAESKGVAPLKPALSRIAALKTKADLATYLGEELRADVDAMDCTSFQTSRLFGLWVAPDLATPTRSVPYLLQGGLGMPDREYYLSTAPTMVETRDKYRAHVETILTLAGIKDAAKRAARVVDLETKMAQVHATRLESLEVKNANNPWPGPSWAKRAPGLDWTRFFAGRRARRTAGGRRLAPEGDRRAVGARRPRAARGLEGLG